MQFRIALEGNLDAQIKKDIAALERGITGAVSETGEGLKQSLRDQVTGAGLGKKLALAWRGDLYPKKQTSLEAAYVVKSNADKIHRAFNDGTTIRSKDGWFLAIPTGNAPKGNYLGKKITPSNWPSERYGPLRFVYRKNGPSLLVVDSQRARKGKRGGFTLASEKARAKGTGLATVVMFILVRQVKLKPKLNIESAAKRWENQFLPILDRRIDAEMLNAGGNQEG